MSPVYPWYYLSIFILICSSEIKLNKKGSLGQSGRLPCHYSLNSSLFLDLLVPFLRPFPRILACLYLYLFLLILGNEILIHLRSFLPRRLPGHNLTPGSISFLSLGKPHRIPNSRPVSPQDSKAAIFINFDELVDQRVLIVDSADRVRIVIGPHSWDQERLHIEPARQKIV